MKKIRLDMLLVEQGYFADADAALRAVLAHEVKVNDVYANSAAVRAALADAGFDATGVVESPITGPEGNVEYLVRAVFEGSRVDGGCGEGGRS